MDLTATYLSPETAGGLVLTMATPTVMRARLEQIWNHVLENFEKTAENIAAAREGLQQVTGGPAYLPVHGSPAGGVPPVHALVPLVTFAYLATKWLAKKRRGQ